MGFNSGFKGLISQLTFLNTLLYYSPYILNFITYARGENTKTNYGMDTTGEKEKRTPKENVDGRSTSSHDNKNFRTRSMEKQRGMAFGFQKTATAVKNTG